MFILNTRTHTCFDSTARDFQKNIHQKLRHQVKTMRSELIFDGTSLQKNRWHTTLCYSHFYALGVKIIVEISIDNWNRILLKLSSQIDASLNKKIQLNDYY